MLSLVDSVTGPVIRSWHIRLPDPARGRREEVHKVQLWHYPFTGQRHITVDGVQVEASQGVPPHKGAELLLVRVGTHDCCVGYRAGPRPGRFFYSCVVDGVVMPELNETVGDEADIDPDKVPRPSDVFVDGVGSAKDSFGAEFLEFRVVTRRGGRTCLSGGSGHGGGGEMSESIHGMLGDISTGSKDGETFAVVWRRFTSFRQLHADVSSVLRGSHLLDSLPPLPAKCLNPLVNQMGKSFVEERRAVLQAYLRRMLEVPKARTSVNLMAFLGLHPVTGSPLPWASLSSSTGPQLGMLDSPQPREDKDVEERVPGGSVDGTRP